MKYFWFLLFAYNLILPMQKDLTPLERLSILHAIATGNLKVDQNTYQCASFIKESTLIYSFPKPIINTIIKEIFDTQAIDDRVFDSDAYWQFKQKHSEVETNESCPSKLQRKYFNVYLQAMKHSGRNVGGNFNNYLIAVLANDTTQMNECAENLRNLNNSCTII